MTPSLWYDITRCEVCKELVADEAKVEAQYQDKVNFVMLNIVGMHSRTEAHDCQAFFEGISYSRRRNVPSNIFSHGFLHMMVITG